MTIFERTFRSDRHTTHYLEAGPAGGPPLIFVHGWPELSLSWRHQIPVFAGLGFRVIAPDMRGYGGSSVPSEPAAYAVAEIVKDMLELLDSLGEQKAIWVGHDWGSPIVWALASHHPDRCHAVANLCVPYIPEGFGPASMMPLIDRNVYSEDQYPAGQWDYSLFYEENFDVALSDMEKDVKNTLKTLFRSGSPGEADRPAPTALIRSNGGWAWIFEIGKDLPLDTAIIDEGELSRYVSALQRNGFAGPNYWYLNGERNREFARHAKSGGRIDIPTLFLAARHDYTCLTVGTDLGNPMREYCARLTEQIIDTGHWMAQERPIDVNAAICKWIVTELPDIWPR